MLTAGRIFSLLDTFLKSKLLYGLGSLVCWLSVVQANAEQISIYNNHPAKQSAQNNVEIYTQNIPGSEFVLFRGTAVFNSTMDSVLAVVFDSSSYVDWLYQCKESDLINEINFTERYQYQVIHVPFPFADRDMIVYSKLQHDVGTGEIIISFYSSSDYCIDKNTPICKRINSSRYVRIQKIIGSYYLQNVEQGIKMTWIQHTEPGGELPGWLVNLYVVETPFQSLLKLAEKLKEEKYQNARLVYDSTGHLSALDMLGAEPNKKPTNFVMVPTF